MHAMRCKRLIYCVLAPCFVMCVSGCTWIPYAIDNVSSAIGGYYHEQRFLREAEDLADTVWNEVGVGDLACKRCTEFERGFKTGFVEYLDANGDGSPPAVPPRRLRHHVLRSDREQRDIDDWFAGYRLGAQVAAQGGYRQRIVIPISLAPYVTDETYGKQVIPAKRHFGGDGSMPGVAVFE